MNEKMFISLARNNIKKNKGVFFPSKATDFTVMKRCAACFIWGPGSAAYLQPELFFTRTAFC